MNRINVPTKTPYFEGTKALDGNTYKLTFKWNTNTKKWYVDIVGISNNVKMEGLACLCGKDLLKKNGYSELGELWIVDNLEQDEDPDFYSFGSRHTVEYESLA